MKKKTLVAVNREQYQNNLVELSMLIPVGVELDKPLQVTVEPAKRPRSNRQNARMWAIHAQVAAWMNMNSTTMTEVEVRGKILKKPLIWSSDMVHDTFFKPLFVSPILERKATAGQASSKLSVDETSEAQEKYLAWCFSLGMEIDI